MTAALELTPRGQILSYQTSRRAQVIHIWTIVNGLAESEANRSVPIVKYVCLVDLGMDESPFDEFIYPINLLRAFGLRRNQLIWILVNSLNALVLGAELRRGFLN